MKGKFRSFFAATLISRIFGYGRDLAIAHFIGGGYWADLYFASFRLANFLRNLVGEGGLYAAYTPVYSSLLGKNETDAKKFAHAYGSALALALVLLVTIGILAARPLTGVLLMGFSSDAEKILWATKLTRILLPFLLCVTMAAWAQATIQSHNRFFLSGLSPILASLAIILFLLWAGPRGWIPENLIVGLAWATTLGGLAQYLVQLPQLTGLVGFGGLEQFRSSHPELKRSLALLGPYAATFSLDQLNAVISTFLASFTEPGSITALYNSSRLIQLPLGLVGVGTLVTSLPELSRFVDQGRREQIRDQLARQKERILLLLIPAVLALIFLGPFIIRLLYLHGRFDKHALRLTADVLALSAPSLLFYSLQKVYLGLFYAHRDTKSLIWSSLLSVLVNAFAGVLTIKTLGARGIALAASLSSLTGLITMAALTAKRGYLRN